MSLTQKALAAALLKLEDEEKVSAAAELADLAWSRDSSLKVTLEDGTELTPQLVRQNGGGEGEGENVSIVFTFTEYPEQFWQLHGSYDSWNGTDWSSGNQVEEVFPTIVTSIEYLNTPPK